MIGRVGLWFSGFAVGGGFVLVTNGAILAGIVGVVGGMVAGVMLVLGRQPREPRQRLERQYDARHLD